MPIFRRSKTDKTANGGSKTASDEEKPAATTNGEAVTVPVRRETDEKRASNGFYSSSSMSQESPRESILKNDVLPDHPISSSESIPENMRQRTFETSVEEENLPGGGHRVVKVTKEREIGSSRTTTSSEYSSRTPTSAATASRTSTPASTLTRESARNTLNATHQETSQSGFKTGFSEKPVTPEPERERRYATKLNTFADKVSDLRQKSRDLGGGTTPSGGQQWERDGGDTYAREKERIARERAEFESRMQSLEREIEEHKRSSAARPEWYQEASVPRSFDRIDDQIRRMEQDFDRFCRTNQSQGPFEVAKFRDGHDFDKFFITSPIVEERGQRRFRQTFDLARFKPEEVSITTRDNIVSIEAKHSSKGSMSAAEYEYRREFALPEGVVAEELESTYKPDGTLVLEAPFHAALPKLEKERSIPITRR